MPSTTPEEVIDRFKKISLSQSSEKLEINLAKHIVRVKWIKSSKNGEGTITPLLLSFAFFIRENMYIFSVGIRKLVWYVWKGLENSL